MLSQAEIGVIVADRDGIVVFSNEYVARLCAWTDRGLLLVGEPLGGLGLLPDSEPGRAAEIARQVLSGWPGRTRSPATGPTAACCSSGSSRCRSATRSARSTAS